MKFVGNFLNKETEADKEDFGLIGTNGFPWHVLLRKLRWMYHFADFKMKNQHEGVQLYIVFTGKDYRALRKELC